MIKTLHIIGYVIVALAVLLLAGFFFVGYNPVDKTTEDFLKAPTAIESFDKNAASGHDNGQSPLVKQAGAFALCLNPPPPPEPVKSSNTGREPPRPVEIKPQFNLAGISYCAENPSLSIAFIDQPGKGLHWVKEGGKIEHFTIQKIKENSIELLNGSQRSELKAPEPRNNNLVKKSSLKLPWEKTSEQTKPSEPDPASPQPPTEQNIEQPQQTMEESVPQETAQQPEEAAVPEVPEDPAITQKQIEIMNDFRKKLDEADGKGELTDEHRQVMTEEFNKKMEQLNPRDANTLQDLGKELNNEAIMPVNTPQAPVPPPPAIPEN